MRERKEEIKEKLIKECGEGNEKEGLEQGKMNKES